MLQLLATTDEQVASQVGGRPQHLPRVVVTEHPRQGRIGRVQTLLQAGLEDAVYRVFEQPFVAIPLRFQLFQARQQLRVMALAHRMTA
ncbi:hypothetical protein D3C86_2055080 [compost metagenome]